MARYIDADVFLKSIGASEHCKDCECNNNDYECRGHSLSRQDICDIVDAMQTADVVEVVRCEDCKHGNYFIDAHTDNYGTSVKAKVYCRIWQDWVSANGYCFLADKRERREDGNNC